MYTTQKPIKGVLSMKKVLLAMDTGFDGCKICINGYLINIPFAVFDITGKDYQFLAHRSSDDFIRSEIAGKTHLLGERAKISLLESKQRAEAKQMDTFYTIGRFKTEAYKVALKSFIGYALYKYEQYSLKNDKDPFTIKSLNEGKVELYVGSALPHSQKDEIWEESVLPTLLEPISLNLLVGEEAPVSINIQLTEDNLCMNSQVISAMFAVTLDEEGNFKPECIGDQMLPMLVIDAGYLTVGIFLFSQNGQVVVAESNQEFAMHNVNERTANIMKEHRSDITPYNVETLAKKNEKIRYSYKQGNETVYNFYDVAQLRNKEIERAATNLNSYLCNTFNDLLDVKSIVVAGGTGDQYYKHLEPDYKKRLIDAQLARPEMAGETHDPVFAVVIGLYRSMLQLFQ